MIHTENSPVVLKTLELCQSIVDQPEFVHLTQQVDSFHGDETMVSRYRELNERGSLLQEKQRRGEVPEEAEIAEFERLRQAFLDSPVARGFLGAQQSMHEVREMVNRYITRTLELGRVPRPEDFHSCNCDSGCGCG